MPEKHRTAQQRSAPAAATPRGGGVLRPGPGCSSPRRFVSRTSGRLLLGALVAGLALGTVSGAAGAPTPSVAEVQKKVETLEQQAEVASEKYNETREELASITVRVRAAQERLARQRAEVAVARQQVGRLAAETYRRGEFSGLDFMLRDDPDAALAQAGLLPRVGDRQAGAMQRLEAGEKQLAADEAELAAQQERLQRADTELRLHRNAVNQRLAETEALLGRLKAAERAAVLAATTSVGIPGPGGNVACRGFSATAADARVRAVLDFACSQLGDPYVWAAEGPNTWDCSGLTMQAWRAAGVSLPHSSRMQATYGSRVMLSDLRAGDLVFFHSPISHVGIYLGGGMMVHAPRTGDVVKVARMWTTPSAAVRL